MADVNANIGINIDTSQSLAEIKNLQRQLAQLYTGISRGSAAAAAAQKGLATNLMNSINAGGKFYAQMGTIRTSTESFTHALEKNKLTMREYFRYAGASTRTFGKLFKSEFATIGRVAEERVKKMQTQYIKMGRDASGAMRAMSITPTTLNMKDYGTQVAIAAQKQALLNQLLRQGSTNLLNFGKNTQWAGRQLMVGFTVPLLYFGTAAAKTFMDLEKQALRFRRVYGSVFTSTAETEAALKDIEELAKSFTKYGVAVVKTMEMAANAAAMGKTGADLTAQVANATRLAVLGSVEQEQALETTISVTNAFGIAAEDLAKKIDFLNAVENQTVVSIEDLTIAIPKAGPVVKQLGGSVEDLAFFLTAMKEGGINASEGANALKSGLASLINPTEKASKMLGEMGINIKGIVEANQGDIKATVVGFAAALDTLDPLNRARAIEQLFGKFQFARLSTLFQNVSKEGTQAAKVFDLMGASVEELAILSERELKAVEDSVGVNFKEAVEKLKVTIAPIGKEFLKAITPVIEFFGKLLDKFNGLGDGAKKFIVVLTTLVGLVGPTLLMTFGLLANGAANIIKLFILMRGGFLKLGAKSTVLAQQTQYLSTEQMEAATVAASLGQAHSKLTQQFTVETSAVNQLRNAYVQATIAARNFAIANPGMMARGGGAIPKKFNSGTMKVPGYSKGTDSVPAMLTPGEAVIPEPIAQDERFKPLIAALVSGEVAKYQTGTTNVGGPTQMSRGSTAFFDFDDTLAGTKKALGSWMQSNGIAPDAKLTQAQYDQFNKDVLNGKVKVPGITKNIEMLKKMQRSGMDVQILSARMQNETNLKAVKQFLAANGINLPGEKIHLQPGSRFQLGLGAAERDSLFKKGFIESFGKGAKGSKVFLIDDNISNVKAVDSIRNKNVRTLFSMPVKREARIMGRGSDGKVVIQFNGKKYLTSDIKSALALTNRINGELFDSADEKSRKAYLNYVSRRLDNQLAKPKNKGLVNVSNVFKQKDKPGGSSGFGTNNPQAARILKSMSPGSIGRLNAEAFDKETIKLKDALKAQGLSPKQIQDFVGKGSSSRQASHLLPPGDTKMKWFTGQVAQDYPGLNNYLNRAKGTDIEGAIKRLVSDSALRRQLGYSDRDIKKLAVDYQFAKSGAHPTSIKDLQSIGRLAALEERMVSAGVAPKSMVQNINQARGVLGLLKVRQPRFYKDYFKRVVSLGGGPGEGTGKQITRKQLERLSKTARAQALRAAGLMLSPGGLVLATKGETLFDERGRKKGKITGQNTAAKKSTTKRVGGTSLDTREIMTKPGQALGYPRFRFASGLNPNAPIPFSSPGATGTGPAITQSQVAQETRRTQKSIEKERKARDNNTKSTVAESKAKTSGTKEQVKQTQSTRRYTEEQRKAASDRAKSQPRDASGRFIKGVPNAAEQKQQRQQQISQRMGQGAMAAGGIAMVGMMSGNMELAKFAAGLSAALGILSMFSGAAMGVAAVLMVLGAAFYSYTKSIKKAREDGVALSKALTMTTDKLIALSKITGKVSGTEASNLRRTNILTGQTEAQRKVGQNILSSDAGKSILDSIAQQSKAGGTQESIGQNIGAQISQAILSGVMSVEEGRSFAAAIGEQLKDYTMSANIEATIVSIMGPNGENLEKDPISIFLEVDKRSFESSKEFIEFADKNGGFFTQLGNQTTTSTSALKGELGLFKQALAGLNESVFDTFFDPKKSGLDKFLSILTLGGTSAFFDIRDANAETVKLHAASAQLMIEELKNNQQLHDSIDKQYNTKIQMAKTEEEINNLEDERLSAHKKLNTQNSDQIQQLIKMKDLVGVGAFNTAISDSVAALYKEGPLKTIAENVTTQLAQLEDSQFKTYLQLQLASGNIDVITIENLMNNEELTKQFNLIAKSSSDKDASLIFQLLNKAGYEAEEIEIILKTINPDGESPTEELTELSETLANLKQTYGIDVKLAGGPAAKDLQNLLRTVGDKKTFSRKELEVLAKTNPEYQYVYDSFTDLVGLDPKATLTRTMLLNLVGLSSGDSDVVDFYLQSAGTDEEKAVMEAATKGGMGVGYAPQKTLNQTSAAYVVANKQNFLNYQSGGGIVDDTPDKGGREGHHLDELLKRLKFIGDASIDAEGKVKELMRITGGKGITKFSGVMQQLMAGPKGGFNREFIGFLEGMDNKTRAIYMTEKKGKVILTEKGKALKEAFNEKVVREYQVANGQALQDTKAQGAALLKLQASGVDSATALEMVADANLAVAINSKNITGKELRKMAKDAKAAKDEVKKLNLEVLVLAEDLKKKVVDAGDALKAVVAARQSGIVDPEMLKRISQNQELVNEIVNNGMSPLAKGIIESYKAMDQLGEMAEGVIDPAKAAIDAFDKLKEAANKVFDKQSRKAQLDFETSMKRIAGTVAKLPAAFASLTIEGAISKANEDIDVLNREIDEIQYRDIRPLDIQIEAKESAIDDIMKGLETQAAGMKKGFKLPPAAYQDVAQGLKDQISEMELDLEFNPKYGARFIEQLQDQISDIELEIELNFSRPIAELQEESSDLSNDLTLMDRITDGINKKYDAQAEALKKISDVNQEILNQQKSQLDIAGALSKGDIAAAARAAQEARAQSAAAASQRAGGVLDAARQAETSAVRSPGGLTRAQIEERQFQISQQVYQLEEQSEARQRSILALQDQIRGIEEIRTQKQRDIRDIQDQIAAGERAREAFIRSNVLPLETQIKDLQEKRKGFVDAIKIKEGEILKIQNEILAPLEIEVAAREKILKDQLAAIDAQKLAYDQAREKLVEALDPATEFAKQAGNAETAFTNAKNKYEEMTKLGAITIRINEIVTRVVNEVPGSTVTGTKVVDGRTVITGLQKKMYGGRIDGYMGGGKVRKAYMAAGGAVGSDTVPAMLTPGEYVVNKASSKAFAPFLTAINESKYPSVLANKISNARPIYQIPIQTSLNQPSYNISTPMFNTSPTNIANASYSDNSSAVYNYSVGISVGGTSASPETVAKAVMNEIKYLDSQRVKKQRVS